MMDIDNLADAIRREREDIEQREYARLMLELAELRRQNGITYARLAMSTQIDRSYIHLMERCGVNTAVTKVINLADALGYRLVLVPKDSNGDLPRPQQDNVS